MDGELRDLVRAFELFERLDIEELVRLKLLSIRGVEVTQGVQHYRADEHLTDPLDRGPDNSVRIVASKPAWVRVYVRALLGPIAGVTGTMSVHRRRFGFLWDHVVDLAPQPPGTVTAQQSIDYATERGDTDNTLNFVVPADVMCGRLRFDITVTDGSRTASRSVEVDATLRQTLRMRIVPVSYDGTDAAGNPLTLAAPTLADAQAEAAWSLLIYPVQSTPDISLTAEVELTFPLTGSPASPGGCAQSWINLNQLVAQARTADGNQADTFYYGLVPAAVPLGANSGCASSGVTSGSAGRPVTMAHEFGHALGYPHAPCGNVGGGDPNFPAYEPYDPAGTPGATLGEYGLDISTGDVKAPGAFRDYMSYCGPRWISLFNYQRAIDHATLNPVAVCHDRPWKLWDEILVDDWWWLKRPLPDPPPWYEEIRPVDLREPVISVIGVRHLTGEMEIRSITRTRAVPEVRGGHRTAAVVELVDEKGTVMAAAPVMRLTGEGECGCGGCDEAGDERGPYLFQAYLPDAGRGACLRVVEAGEERCRWDAPSAPLEAPRLDARANRTGGLSLRWRVGKSERPVEVWVRWRARTSDEPQVLCVVTGSGRRTVDTGAIPAGEVVLDAVAHDGFSTSVSEPVVVKLPARRPEVAILHPYDRRTLQAGRTLRLQGMATDAGGAAVPSERCVWRIDGKEVATGLDVFVVAPDEGEHTVTFTVESKGGRGQASARLFTVGPGRDERDEGGSTEQRKR